MSKIRDLPLNKPGQRALRRGRFSQAGQLYLLTMVTRDRLPVFRDYMLARRLVRCLFAGDLLSDCDCQAWVLMPDHFHGLIQLADGMALSSWVRLFKGRSARHINAMAGCRGAFWQPGFHDHALRSDEDIKKVARYIIANPLRAGLVERIGDYPHWDCAWL